jgi:FHS family L-fucose permease-like MFS transporter
MSGQRALVRNESPHMRQNREPIILSSHAPTLIAIAGLFAIWGMAQWDYSIVFPRLAQFFGFNASQTTWTQTLFNVTYVLFAIPTALFHRRFGYKLGVTVALSVISLGPFLFYPAIMGHYTACFISAVVMLGIGWAALETSLNPLAVELGPSKTAVRRLNLVQAFYPIGLVAGYFVAQKYLMSFYQHPESHSAQFASRPYVVVGLMVLFLAFAIDWVWFPGDKTKRDKSKTKLRDEFRTLFSNHSVLLGMLALFCCILSLSTTLGGIFSYIAQQLPSAAGDFPTTMFLLSCILLGIGRFAGTGLMYRFDPLRLLLWGMGVSVALVIAAAALGGVAGLGCLLGTSLFLTIAYPTIFATTIRNLGPLTKLASGLLVTAAGVASAFTPLVNSYALSVSTSRTILLLTVPCFLVVIGVAAALRRFENKEPRQQTPVLASAK